MSGYQTGPSEENLCNQGHQPGEHDITCIPDAKPGNAQISLLRAIYGLCPECNNTEAHTHAEDSALD